VSGKPATNITEQYTVSVNQNDANLFPWGSIQWLCSDAQFAGANLTFGYVEIQPGQKNPRHYHPNSSEMLYLIEGELDHSLEDKVIHLEAGTAIFIGQNVKHDAVNRGERTARMVVAYPTGDRQAVMLEEGDDK
jgi:quercetin dioxygenase-like cupin family protein